MTAAPLLLAPWIALAAPQPGVPKVEWVAPAAGAVLEAGREAWLEWRGDEQELAARGIVEWEAFLSVDGGEYFGVRLTPHLDIGIRRFAFRVPPLVSEDVRLLLRMGDEVKEVGVDVPGRFAIRSGSLSTPLGAAIESEGGEAARPGERGVVLWLDGTRHASNLQQRRARSDPDFRPVSVRGLPGPLGWLAPPEARDPLAAPALDSRAVPAAAPVLEEVAAGGARPDLLLLLQRRNE